MMATISTTNSIYLSPIPFPRVTIQDAFWTPRLETSRGVTIPHVYEQCKATGRIDAFKLDWRPGKPNEPHIFWDSDVAKWVEGASCSLATHPNEDLDALLDEVITLIVSAQQPDGYLNVHFTAVEPEMRWTNLRDWHELYCAGHLIEAAVAHYQATGKRTLLDAMCRYTDYIDTVFGSEPGKIRGYPGHEEIELALIKLYRDTGQEHYLKLCQYFVDERGTQPHFFDAEAIARGEDPRQFWHRGHEYNQSHLPVRRQTEAVGHAVRAMYLYSGMADLAAETDDVGLLTACRCLWDSVTLRKMYLTGGIGSHHAHEDFGGDYELPNASAYSETCAAIGLVFFAHRMLQFDGHSRYADVMERALYNNILAGVSLRGDTFFYVNPLTSDGSHHRQGFFDCACCPPNIIRLLASLGQYVYSVADKALYVHLYIAGKVETENGGQPITLTQRTDYPWDGAVQIALGLQEPASFDLMLRIPDWCRQYELRVNGQVSEAPVLKGYARLRRRWSDGDEVVLNLAMPVERIVAHPKVAADAGKVALQRGPLVYCLEQCDHVADVRSILLPDDAQLTVRFDRDLLGGAVVIEGTGLAPSLSGWENRLYGPAEATATESIKVQAIPYCLWDNRQAGAMTVWLPRA